MLQEYRKTILIICEGQRSEPDYFNNLRNEVIAKNKHTFIKILPIPKDEAEKIENDINDFNVRKGGKKRQLKKSLREVEREEYIIENEYRAQPTSYVRRAQLAYLEHGFSEMWAIYDKDGHAQHPEAFRLSRNLDVCNKIVNIGFSSISFEQWILMHFENCNIPFLKSQCRDNNKHVFHCGTHANELDCQGERCVVGRIVKMGFINYNSSKNFDYADYAWRYNAAFKNALLSRDQAIGKIAFYNNNPYVTLDRLVFKLIHLDKGDLVWEYNPFFEVDSKIFVNISCHNNCLKIEIINQSSHLFIIANDFVRLIDIEFNILWSNVRFYLEPDDSCVIYVNDNISLDDFNYGVFRLNDSEFKILDVVQMKNFTQDFE